MGNALAMKALEKVREHNARIAALESELAASSAQVATLREALRETLQSLEDHLDDDCAAKGVSHRDILCPCNTTCVPKARAALAATEAQS